MRTKPIFAVLACVAVGILSAPPAMAEPDAAASAMLRAAHFSPDTPAVDVYLTGFDGGSEKLALSDVGYGDVSDYSALPPGQYTVGMRPAGADPSTPVVFSWTLDAKPGAAFTALAIGMNTSLEGRVLSDDLTAPPSGQTRVRVVQAADNAGKADITAKDGPVFGMGLPFTSTTDYSVVPAGSYPVTARSSDKGDVVTTSNLTLAAGRANTVVLLDGPQGGIALKSFDDAIGVNLPPQGPVNAGAGATAGAASWLRTTGIAMTALALVATVALLGVAIRRPGRSS